MIDRRQAAVDHLSSLLERDLLDVEAYRALVDRILAATTDAEVGNVLARLPSTPPLVLRCDSGVQKEAPLHLPAVTEIICRSGVMKVDLSYAELEHPVVDVEIDCESGVMVVMLPRDVVVELGDHSNSGGVTGNKLRLQRLDPDAPRIVVHVRNGGGVIKLRHPRRWFRRGRR